MSDVRVVLTRVSGAERVAAALGAVAGVEEVRTPPLDEVADALGDADVLVTWQWSDEWLDSGIGWIQSYSAGVDQFPVEQLAEHDIVLTSAVGIHDVQVSEHAFGLLLGLTRGIGMSAKQQTTRTWRWPAVTELSGMTLGIIGLGVIGEAIVRKAKAFDMTVLGTKRRPDRYEGVADEVVGAESTTEVFRRSDAVIAVLPDTPETRGMIGAEQFEALRDGYFVNVGRGSVVDEDALVAALRDATLAGAGLDVFAEEPLPETSPLWDLPNALVSPHVAGVSPRYGDRLAALLERNLAAFHGEGEWVNRVT